MGIWKEVRLEMYDSAIIRHITHQLIEGSGPDEEFWILNIFVHMETGLERVELDGVVSCELK